MTRATHLPSSDDLGRFLRDERNGGIVLLAATLVALAWANLAGGSYDSFWASETTLGPAWLDLDLTLGDWAADGLLAIFFFVAGVELKRELVVGELSDRRAAALPVIAAVGGMVVPALVALAVSGGEAAEGGAWAIPVATDIAFALGVLALVGAALPSGVRVLLLSIAVVDDLIAIALIAVIFTQGLSAAWLAAAAAFAALYWGAFRHRLDASWFLWVLAVAVWVCVHASGVHATAAGIVLGLLTPVRPRAGERVSRGARLEHRLHPISAGLAVPVFALAAAGVSLAAVDGAVADQVAVAVFAGLLVGKVAGLYGAARVAVALRVGTLPPNVRWGDVLPIAILGSIGFTVSLLIARLAFDDPAREEHAAIAILAASVAGAVAGAVLLRSRDRATRRSRGKRG
jgi:NhaA family Na+:H+ antiporter